MNRQTRKRAKKLIPAKILFLFALLLVIGLIEITLIMLRLDNPRYDSPTRSPSDPSQTEVKAFDKTQHSINEPASLWVVVDKGRILPSAYVPDNLTVPNVLLRDSATSSNMHLRRDAARALEALFDGASEDKLSLRLASGYRSYATQTAVYNGYVRNDGQKAADDYSARPGHSEHQTGLAADIAPSSLKCQLDPCFADTPEGRWVAANAYKYGFIISYPRNKKALTGYEYEPWHLRYVGKGLAVEIKKTGQTLEQFLGLPGYADYPAEIYRLR